MQRYRVVKKTRYTKSPRGFDPNLDYTAQEVERQARRKGLEIEQSGQRVILKKVERDRLGEVTSERTVGELEPV